MDNVIEKIRKLLALAGGESDHEAKAAMLKARELMAQHKLSEKDIVREQPGSLNKEPYIDDSFSKVRNWWFLNLAKVIAENHCCSRASYSTVGGGAYYLMFIGLDDDPKIACEIFGYAVQYIKRRVDNYKCFLKGRILDVKERNRAAREWENSYAVAFSHGLEAQYAEQFRQKEQESMALALVKPVEVTRYMDSLKKRNIKIHQTEHNVRAAAQGWKDGYNFNPVKQIPGE